MGIEYVDDVQRIMTEELTKAIGYPLTLAREYWDVFNIKKVLKTGVHHINIEDGSNSKEEETNIA